MVQTQLELAQHLGIGRLDHAPASHRSGCPGAGLTDDEEGSDIAAACVYLGDRLYNDSLNDYLGGERDDLACRDETDSEGRFKAIAGVAGSGKHDFWIVAWKEGYAAHSQRVWRGDGSPSGPVNVSVTLASE